MASQIERVYAARSGSSATNSTTVAMVAATAKTVVAVLGAASDTIGVKSWRVSFSSVTSTDVPATVELGVISAIGTVTSFTPVQIAGIALSAASSAGYNASGEPTFTKILETLYVPVQQGIYEKYYPLGEEPVVGASTGFAIRVTSPSAVNCYAEIVFAE